MGRSMSQSRANDVEFQAFWRAYPNRQGAAAAWLAWQKSRPIRPPLAELLAAIDQAKTWRARQEQMRKFVPAWPHPSTWLNGERWADEFDLPQPEAAPAPKREPTADEIKQRRLAELARDCWIQVRFAVMKNTGRPLLGWGHAAADQVLAELGGLEALAEQRSRLQRVEAEFLSRMARAMRQSDIGGTVVQLARRA